jgi:hypothetical protein
VLEPSADASCMMSLTNAHSSFTQTLRASCARAGRGVGGSCPARAPRAHRELACLPSSLELSRHYVARRSILAPSQSATNGKASSRRTPHATARRSATRRTHMRSFYEQIIQTNQAIRRKDATFARQANSRPRSELCGFCRLSISSESGLYFPVATSECALARGNVARRRRAAHIHCRRTDMTYFFPLSPSPSLPESTSNFPPASDSLRTRALPRPSGRVGSREAFPLRRPQP